MVDPQLTKEDYYHGLLPREDIKSMLRKNGEFLVRTTEPKPGQQRCFVLSVMVHQDREEDGIKHFVISQSHDHKYIIDRYGFNSVPDMIHHHLSTKESVTKKDEVIISHPVGRNSWELHHEDIELTKKLGEGAFGEVHMGKLKMKKGIIFKQTKEVPVAVKLAKLEVLTKEQIKEIMNEARLMRRFDHPNVVKFYGVAAGQEPLMVLMELANGGSLDSYLQKNQLPPDKLHEMILQSALGIEYIHSKSVLHRDLAARNCLYGDGKVKISDFGLSREGTFYQMDPHKRVPIRWLAVETLKSAVYSQKTDVWAFGIMCWEIFNQGHEPYPGMTVAEVNDKIRTGYRMELPSTMKPDVQAVVKKCWTENSNDRYTMPEVVKHLQRSIHSKNVEMKSNDKSIEVTGGGGNTSRHTKKRKK